jgi:hypothetical protein
MSLSNKITIIERLLGVLSEENTKKSFSKIRRRISFENVSTHIKKYVNSCGRVRHKSSQWYKKCVINGLVIDLWQENMHNFEGVDIDEFYDLLEEFLIEKYGDEVEDEIKKFRDDKSIVTESKTNEFIKSKFDKVFNKLKLERTDDELCMYNWYYKGSDKKVFERNHWGRFWIYGCEEYKELLLVKKLLSISYEEFEKILIYYLNKRYDSQFEEQPLKDIGNENCYDENEEIIETELTERCWKGYTQKGMKTMFGKRYPNCVKKTKK